MVYFQRIQKTKHYREHHEKEFPWHEVVEVILGTKNPRRNGDIFEIDNEKCYIVFKIEKGTLSVINAKRK